jgi:hypothetical protein
MFALFDPKITVQPTVFWWVGGVVAAIGVTIGTVTKVMTRGYITKKDAFKKFRTSEMCDERSGHLEGKLDDLKGYVCGRFDVLDRDIKEILKNGRAKG